MIVPHVPLHNTSSNIELAQMARGTLHSLNKKKRKNINYIEYARARRATHFLAARDWKRTMKHATIILSLLVALFACGVAHADDYENDYENQAPDLQYQGVVESNGVTFTWYSENVLPGEGLDALNGNGRTVNASGYVVDGEGYIAVASPWGADEIGTVIETPWGLAKVYDTCEDDSYDVYTSWNA